MWQNCGFTEIKKTSFQTEAFLIFVTGFLRIAKTSILKLSIWIASFQNEAIQIFDHLRVILILGRPPQHAVPSNRPSATSRHPAIHTQGHFRGGVRE